MTSPEMQRKIFVIGIASLAAYYFLTCLVFLITPLSGHSSVTIHLNLFGEMWPEIIITILSLPCAFYAIKEAIRLKKQELRRIDP